MTVHDRTRLIGQLDFFDFLFQNPVDVAAQDFIDPAVKLRDDSSMQAELVEILQLEYFISGFFT